MRVSHYEVFLFHRVVTYGTQGSCWTMVQMRLHNETKKNALLVFYDPERTPNVPKSRGGDNPLVFVPKDQYPWHVDLLRHESPIDFADDDSKWWFGSLRTASREPVGEGE